MNDRYESEQELHRQPAPGSRVELVDTQPGGGFVGVEGFQQALQRDVRELWERCLTAVYIFVESLVVHCCALGATGLQGLGLPAVLPEVGRL